MVLSHDAERAFSGGERIITPLRRRTEPAVTLAVFEVDGQEVPSGRYYGWRLDNSRTDPDNDIATGPDGGFFGGNYFRRYGRPPRLPREINWRDNLPGQPPTRIV